MALHRVSQRVQLWKRRRAVRKHGGLRWRVTPIAYVAQEGAGALPEAKTKDLPITGLRVALDNGMTLEYDRSVRPKFSYKRRYYWSALDRRRRLQPSSKLVDMYCYFGVTDQVYPTELVEEFLSFHDGKDPLTAVLESRSLDASLVEPLAKFERYLELFQADSPATSIARKELLASCEQASLFTDQQEFYAIYFRDSAFMRKAGIEC